MLPDRVVCDASGVEHPQTRATQSLRPPPRTRQWWSACSRIWATPAPHALPNASGSPRASAAKAAHVSWKRNRTAQSPAPRRARQARNAAFAAPVGLAKPCAQPQAPLPVSMANAPWRLGMVCATSAPVANSASSRVALPPPSSDGCLGLRPKPLPRPYAENPSSLMGSVRTRCPVAAKMALHTAGARGGSAGSPSPVGSWSLATKCTSTSGVAGILSSG